MPTIQLEALIRASPEACFALSLSVDAHTASMRQSGERAVAGVTSGEMQAGETVTWRAKHFGIPWRMTSLISAYDRPTRFVDEQLNGPFARWLHEHRFEAVPEGTRMVDHVEYASPMGPLGRIVDRIFLQRYMTRLLVRRNRWLSEELQRR